MLSELKILAFIRHYPPPFDGGGYYYNYNLFKELQRLGCEITILSHSKSMKQPGDNGIRIIPIQSIKTGRFFYHSPIFKLGDLISNILVMKKYLSNDGYDFVFSDAGYMGNLTVFIANLMKGIPVVGINLAEEIKVLQQTTRFRSWLQRYLLKSHYINIGISRYTQDLLLACGVRRSSVIIAYPFVEKKPARDKAADRQFLVDTYNLNKDSLIVGFLGRHIPRKGLLNLVEAVEKLLQEKKQITMLIAGHGTDTDRIKERIAHSDNCIHFKFVEVSTVDLKNCFFNGIDLFAMPNYEDPVSGDTEGFGIVFVEAAQYGTPVIGGNVGGVVEAVHHQHNGCLVDGRNVNSIAEAILQYYQNPSLRDLHGRNGEEWAEQFIKLNPFPHLLTMLIDKKNSKRLE